MCFDKGSSLCTMAVSPAVALQQEVRDGNEYWHVFTQPCIDAASKDSENELVSKVRKPYTMTKQRERWSEDEHMKFLEALKLYGRAWRRIEEHIGSKTAVQIRSHAQKFFSKLEREQSTPGTLPRRPQDIEIPPPRPKRKPNHPYPRKAGGAPSSPTVDIRTGDKADTTSSASLFEKSTNLAAGVDPASRVGFAPYNPHLVVQSKLDFIEPSKSMTLFGQTFFLDKTASERKRAQNILQMADRNQTTEPMCVVEDSSKSESSNLSEAHADQTSPAPLVSNIEREVENLGRQVTQDIQSCEKQQAPLGTMNENSMEQSHQAPGLTAKDTELLHEATFKSQFLNSLAAGGHCGGMAPHAICPGLYGPGIWQPMSSLSPAHLSSAMENMWPGLNSAEVMVSEETRAAAAAAATFAAASAWWTLVGAAHHNALSMTEPAYGGQMAPPNNLETTAMQPHRPIAVIIDKGNSEAVRADQACNETRTSDKVGDVLGASQVEQSLKCNQQSGGDSCSSESCDPVIKITKCVESTKKVRGHERATAKLKKSRVISKNADTTKETIGTRISHKQSCTLVGGNNDENLSGDGGPSSNWSACSKGNRSKPLSCDEVENSQCPMSTESELKQRVEVDLARMKGADSSEHLAASLIEAQSTLSNDFSIQKGSDLNSKTGHNKISTASRSEISDVETMESTLTKKQLRRLEGSCSSNSVNTLQMQEDQEEGSPFRAVAAQECNTCPPASPSKPVGVTFCGLAFVPYKRKRVNSLQTDSGKISDGDRESDPCRQEKRNRPADRE